MDAVAHDHIDLVLDDMQRLGASRLQYHLLPAALLAQ
jgi:hypothetical protein